MRFKNLIALVPVVFLAVNVSAGTFYVDYEQGVDSNTGTQTDAPWKHAPGDTAALGNAKSAKLQPGDVVKFKGGVVYHGSISIPDSGAEGKPITYDGNLAGDWGTGKAIIDGSTPLENLKQCATAEEAWGNPNFKNIYWTTVPKGAKWNMLNLCQGLVPLAWSEDPNPADPNFQEDPKHFHKTDPDIPQTLSGMRVRPINGMKDNAKRPLMTMFDGGNDSAVIENISAGGEIEVAFEKPVTVVEFAVTPQKGYTNPKEITFTADGKELLKAELADNPDKTTEQRFKLPAPETFQKLVIKFVSAHPGKDGTTKNWGAVKSIAGFDAAGANVMAADSKSVLRNEKVFTEADPHFFDNALLALFARPSLVYYKRIQSYDPAAHQISFETLTHTQIPYDKGGAFSIVNSPRFIDIPGEYAMLLDPEADGSHKILLWPPNGKPEDITRGEHGVGIAVGGSYVTVQGFWIRKQGWDGTNGITARGGKSAEGKGTDLIIRDCKVTNLRGDGVGITTTQMDNLLIDGCEVADNAGHTKGIVLRNATNVVARNCVLHRNSSTAMDFYTVNNGVVQDCFVYENPGMHANGLTFYVGCKNILIERNRVRDGNVALTVQDGDGMIVRNNVLEGGGDAPAIGLWAGGPFNNIVITNNVIRYHGGTEGWSAAVYGGNANAKGYAIVNNVIDGFSGNVTNKAVFNHNIFTAYGPALPKELLGENTLVPNPADIFVDPAKDDYRLKPGSPAIDAGVAITTINQFDREGVKRPVGKAIDIGPNEHQLAGSTNEPQPVQADPHTFKFTLDGYVIAEPVARESVYAMKFKKIEGGQSVLLKGVDLTGEGGGKVNLRPTKGGYISGWDKPGHWIEWTVDAPKAGKYEVCIEHGSEQPAKRQVILNGEPVKGLEEAPFAATGGWTNFDKAGLDVALSLKAGKNVIRFVNVSGSHNFKSLEFIPVTDEK